MGAGAAPLPVGDSSRRLGQGLLDTKPTIPDWTDQGTDTSWWSLTYADILSGGSAPQPPGEYRKADISAWLQEVARFRQELTSPPPSRDSSLEVVYIGDVGLNCRGFQQQHQGTQPRRAPSTIAVPNSTPSADTGQETQRRICRGRARLLRADIDIRSIRKSSSQLFSLSSILLNRTEDQCIRDPALGNKIHQLSHVIASVSEELKEVLDRVPK